MGVTPLAAEHTSLMHGWVPVTVQALTAVVLVAAIGGRSRRWLLARLPVAAALGLLTALAARRYVAAAGLAGDPAPILLWVWLALAGAAAGIVALGWAGTRWRRRGLSILAVPLCLLSAALALNLWVGYFPTVQTAWNQLTAGPLPDQTDPAMVSAMAAAGTRPRQGRVLPVAVPAVASGFKHRGELVYLPPVWFAHHPPPQLPAVMMIGGEFNTPADWLRAGGAVKTIDDFAAAHDGNAPVLVFVDSGGSFNNDTECVNGPRGNAADHLTKDVLPYMISNFGVSPRRENWGAVGWSVGGTCALDLTVMHPDRFGAFVDIDGEPAPSAGTRAQTITRLFGGDAEAWAAFDPASVIAKHGRYSGVSGWFAVNSAAAGEPGGQLAATRSLGDLGRANGIDCAVVVQPGKHDWPFAARAFTTALPWLAGRLGTPGVQSVGFSGASSQADAGPSPTHHVQPAAR